MRYAGMERQALFLERLKAFCLSRPIAYGAPVSAIVGALAGLAMQTGSQTVPFQPEMAPARTLMEATAEPIIYPSGQLPDYVVGTDFLRAMQPQAVYAASDPSPPLPPPPDVPAYQPGRHGPSQPPPRPYPPRWASGNGGILDVSLPEDHPQQPDARLLADVAATGMTSR